jgi:tetratricopeptide (TPR) repeat protein
MLYLILPPIIIIVALGVLVYFFSRRFPGVEKEITAQLSDTPVTRSYVSRIADMMKRATLYVLERLAQRFKVMTLKTYNMLHDWTRTLRERKIKSTVKPVEDIPKEIVDDTRHTKTIARIFTKTLEKDSSVRPMISRQVTKPEEKLQASKIPPVTTKNQFEDILVERIAANPRDLEAYERLGEYYMEQGNLQDAKECYRQVLRLSPVHRLAKIKVRRLEKMLEQK